VFGSRQRRDEAVANAALHAWPTLIGRQCTTHARTHARNTPPIGARMRMSSRFTGVRCNTPPSGARMRMGSRFTGVGCNIPPSGARMRMGSRFTGVRCSAAKPAELRATHAGSGSTRVREARKKPRQKVCVAGVGSRAGGGSAGVRGSCDRRTSGGSHTRVRRQGGVMSLALLGEFVKQVSEIRGSVWVGTCQRQQSDQFINLAAH